MKIKYVGLKDEETAFSKQTGIVWYPGSEHNIADPKMAARMLSHPDVFAKVEGPEPETPAGEAQDGGDLESLSVEQLRKLAELRGVTVHHAAGKAKIIAALREAA